MKKTHYETLSVSENASKEEIKKQYRKLASVYHPDKKSGNHKIFSAISHAFEVLYDDTKRESYDLDLDYERKLEREEKERLKKEEYNYYQNQKSKKTERKSENKHTFKFPAAENINKYKEKAINLFLKLSLKESQFGCDKVINFERFIICENCSGYGYGFLQNTRKVECMKCMGTGLKLKKETIKLRIQPNTIVGQKLRLKDKGNNSKKGSEFNGDVVVNIVWKGNWDSKNKDIYTSVEISKKNINNGWIYFKNFDGEKLKIYIPKNIKSGQKLKIEKKGWKSFSSDLYLTILFKKNFFQKLIDFFKS